MPVYQSTDTAQQINSELVAISASYLDLSIICWLPNTAGVGGLSSYQAGLELPHQIVRLSRESQFASVMARVPATTRSAPMTIRGVIFSMSRKNSLLPMTTQSGRVAVSGVIITTVP